MQISTIIKKFKTALLSIAVLAAVTSLVVPPEISNALSGGEFSAGNIIDDGVFFDSSTMSSGDVQNFLNSKVPVCDTNGSKAYDGSQTRAQYGAANGNPAPFTCLKDYRQDTPNMAGESGLCNSFFGGNRSAAQIIRDIGSACGINPQVLLVLLQKEESLVTDDWPFASQYTTATGFGCPDTAPCDSSYGGFFYQVYYGARAFKKYSRDASKYSYFSRSNNNIGYNPNSGCGSSNVYLQNQATTGLYVYTPYQPNQAALNNLYGTGDGCSSYGNRNFWRLFNDWFGSTHAAPFAWQATSQEAYSDSGRTNPIDTTTLAPNTTYYFRLRAQNMGNSTWHNSGGAANNQVNLGTIRPNNRASLFADGSWLSSSRPAALIESAVTPGGYGTYEFSIRTPGFYTKNIESLNLVAEGNTWMTDHGVYWPLSVIPPTPKWSVLSQESYYDAGMTQPIADTSTLASNGRYYLRMQVRNTGNTTWTNSGANPVRLGTSSPQDRGSAFYDSTWLSQNRVTTLNESSVAPGQVGTFGFWMQAPYGVNGTSYKEYFRPVADGYAWFHDLGMYYPVTIQNGNSISWSVEAQQVYADSTRNTPVNSTQLNINSTYYMYLKIKNTSGFSWTSSTTNLGTASPKDRLSVFTTAQWLTPNRAARLSENRVNPGESGTFVFNIRTPNGSFNMKEYYTPLIEGVDWFNDLGLYYPLASQ